MEVDYKILFERLTRRYGGATPESIESILCPVLIPIRTLDKTVLKLPKQSHHRASFTINIIKDYEELVVPGRTGKFVPKSYKDGGVWREVAKGRILRVDMAALVAEGEVYCGGKRAELVTALDDLSTEDLLEVDQYGSSAKVLSGLVEYSLVQVLKEAGYTVRRMPEDMARHIGGYAYFDFEVEKNRVTKRVEVKSLWGDEYQVRSAHSQLRQRLPYE